MSELLFLKSLGNDYVLRNVKAVEKYVDTHSVASLRIEFIDTGVLVYDRNVLLINITVIL